MACAAAAAETVQTSVRIVPSIYLVYAVSCSNENLKLVYIETDNDILRVLTVFKFRFDGPRIQTFYGSWAFSVVGSEAWNALPVDVLESSLTFPIQTALKTRLFRSVYIQIH